MIKTKLGSKWGQTIAYSKIHNYIVINQTKYTAENEEENSLLRRLFSSKISCNDVEATIHLICTVTVAEVREE